jgi:hypothetical protein
MRNQTQRKCVKLLQKAQNNGDLRMAKRIMAMLAVADEAPYSVIATTLKVSEESILSEICIHHSIGDFYEGIA